jgi:hypothetical protein
VRINGLHGLFRSALRGRIEIYSHYSSQGRALTRLQAGQAGLLQLWNQHAFATAQVMWPRDVRPRNARGKRSRKL